MVEFKIPVLDTTIMDADDPASQLETSSGVTQLGSL